MLERRRPSDRVARLRDRLAAASRRRLCGRERELGLFRLAAAGRSSPFSILYVHGLGGVGKSALLEQFANEAARVDLHPVRLDGRTVEPSPAGFLHALAEALGLGEREPPIDRFSHAPVVMLTIDSWDALAPLEPWFRNTFLPQLPSRGVVVLAGRNPPSAEWAADPGVGAIFRPLPLRNLSPAESRALLSDRRVPEDQHAAVLRFTHGHPLALVLVADVLANSGPGDLFTPASAPNVVRELLARLVANVPSARHRKALEACARVRVTTEALLGAVVDDENPHELFEWLRGLSFMEQGAEGLFPHDVAREVLDADFRWRDPEGYLAMHRRAWRFIRQRLLATSGRAQQRAFFDKLFLHRQSETGGTFHDLTSLGTVYAQTASPQDGPAIVETVRRHEGDASARLAHYWLERQPQAFRVIRGPSNEILGFVASIVLTDERAEDARVDPAVRAAWAYVRQHGGSRTGEVLTHHRLHISSDGYQDVSPTINLLAMRATLAPVEHRRLAWSFVTFADPQRWLPVMQYINFATAEEASFNVGGRHYGVFAHDWRVEPFETWWDQLCERSLMTEPIGEQVVVPAPALVVLSEPDFSACVRQALRAFTRPDALAANPLVRSRLVAEAPGEGNAAARLQALMREALDTLKGSPRDEKFHRALLYTYFQPVATQEIAAERLGLPFNTYRYHLAKGGGRIADWLWRLELSGRSE